MTGLDLDYQANTYCGMVGKSRMMLDVFKRINETASIDVTVLILGETGVGKELASKAIHKHSRRNNGPHMTVNCAAIPEDLIESELYGHEKGSYTGAVSSRKGKFREADKGTLFLDEIGSMPVPQQSSLLRVLEDGNVTPVGSDSSQKVDVRVIAATNQDLYAAVRSGQFRKDLYYRLSAVKLTIPPLRERVGDIPMLIKYFMEKYQQQYERSAQPFSPGEYIEFMRYRWPGNVRELEGAIKSIVIHGGGKIEMLDQLKNEAELLSLGLGTYPVLGDGSGIQPFAVLKRAEMEAEIRLIKDALEASNGVQTEAARKLKMSFRQLRYKMDVLGLREKKPKGPAAPPKRVGLELRLNEQDGQANSLGKSD